MRIDLGILPIHSTARITTTGADLLIACGVVPTAGAVGTNAVGRLACRNSLLGVCPRLHLCEDLEGIQDRAVPGAATAAGEHVAQERTELTSSCDEPQ